MKTNRILATGWVALLCAFLVAGAGVLPGTAFALDDLALGHIRVSDAGSTNNAETGYANGLSQGMGAFDLENNRRYGVQCDAPGAHVTFNSRYTDAGRGTKLLTDQYLDGETASAEPINPKVDGGTYTKSLISIAPLAGQCCALCKVLP